MNSNFVAQPYVPLQLAGRPLAVKAAAVLLGALFLAACSWVQVPMVPVPITMQTYAITLIGALYGWRLGLATVMAWLAAGIGGLPVVPGAPITFAGPTAGYLVAFPIAAAMVGWLAERGWTAGGAVLKNMLANFLGGTFILIFGGLWLAAIIGFADGMKFGVLPFIVGDILKSILATATIEALRRTGLK